MQDDLYGPLGPISRLPRPGPRQVTALALRQLGHALVRLARRLAQARAAAPRLRPHELEFYAEAGAPEGALYLDGELIGHLPGVHRL